MSAKHVGRDKMLINCLPLSSDEKTVVWWTSEEDEIYLANDVMALRGELLISGKVHFGLTSKWQSATMKIIMKFYAILDSFWLNSIL